MVEFSIVDTVGATIDGGKPVDSRKRIVASVVEALIRSLFPAEASPKHNEAMA
jgi:hypothetical protein